MCGPQALWLICERNTTLKSLDLRGNRISKTSPTGAALAALGERANLAFQRRSY